MVQRPLRQELQRERNPEQKAMITRRFHRSAQEFHPGEDDTAVSCPKLSLSLLRPRQSTPGQILPLSTKLHCSPLKLIAKTSQLPQLQTDPINCPLTETYHSVSQCSIIQEGTQNSKQIIPNPPIHTPTEIWYWIALCYCKALHSYYFKCGPWTSTSIFTEVAKNAESQFLPQSPTESESAF